ncbi:hypothetical protein GCM10007084_25390 [Parabacteroides faecis]|nr:hypothetical protein GCM10007084_25390 [Parabacteroides faecis]
MKQKVKQGQDKFDDSFEFGHNYYNKNKFIYKITSTFVGITTTKNL